MSFYARAACFVIYSSYSSMILFNSEIFVVLLLWLRHLLVTLLTAIVFKRVATPDAQLNVCFGNEFTRYFKVVDVQQWTQNFVKHIECCNFQTITVIHIKVYISGMEMSQKIHFWYQILLKLMIFWENGKKTHFFGQKLLWQANKISLSY